MQIVVGDIGVDFLDQLADAAERPAPNCLLGDEAEPALHLIEPTGVGRGVMDVVARPARQPGLNLGMLVGAVVVRHQMDVEPGRDTAVEVTKKREKFLVAMARLTQGNHFAIKGIECSEQGSSAVAVVIVSYSFDIAQPHRQHRLGAFQRLDLAFLVHAQHQAPCQAD